MEAILTADNGGPARVRSGDAIVELALRKGDRVRLTPYPGGLRTTRLAG